MGAGTVCEICEERTAEEGYQIPMCSECREEMARRPFPAWVKAAAVLVVMLMVAASIYFPGSLRAAAAFERGRAAEARGDYGAAVREYEKAVARYPDSVEAVARLTVAYGRNGDLIEFSQSLEKIKVKEVDSELADELNGMTEALEAFVEEYLAQEGVE